MPDIYRKWQKNPLIAASDALLNAIEMDKKKKSGKLTFIIPDKKIAIAYTIESKHDIETVEKILKGESFL